VGQLRRAGLVSATRGQSGGYQLGRPAEEINMADAVRILEGPLLEMPCAGADNLEVCDRPQPCSVHDLFQRVHESLDLALGSTTLAEVAASAGGPPYPPAVRKRRIAEHAARQAVAAAALVRESAPTYAGATTTDS
jgi:DNA-binding IscR family transcriptional regulator